MRIINASIMEVYLDNAATTPVRPAVADAIHEAMLRNFGNPSSTHKFGRSTKAEIEEARRAIAGCIGAQSSEIVFTSGGTEADNLAIRSAVRDLGVKSLVSTRLEHHAVLDTLLEVSEQFGLPLHYLSVDVQGRISLSELEEVLERGPSPALVSLMHVNNEVGTLTDIEEVAGLCKKYRAFFHSDSVQSVGHYPIDVSQTPVHFLAASAHKFHGPKGIGFAFVRKGIPLKPIITGGAQQRGLRGGTEPYEAIVGMRVALEESVSRMSDERNYIKGLKKRMWEGLKQVVPGAAINGCADEEKGCYRILNVRLPMESDKAQLLLFQLDLKGVACSQGSACQSGSAAGSHVLDQIVPPEQRSHPSLRFSFSAYNTDEEIEYAVGVVRDIVAGRSL